MPLVSTSTSRLRDPSRPHIAALRWRASPLRRGCREGIGRAWQVGGYERRSVWSVVGSLRGCVACRRPELRVVKYGGTGTGGEDDCWESGDTRLVVVGLGKEVRTVKCGGRGRGHCEYGN